MNSGRHGERTAWLTPDTIDTNRQTILSAITTNLSNTHHVARKNAFRLSLRATTTSYLPVPPTTPVLVDVVGKEKRDQRQKSVLSFMHM